MLRDLAQPDKLIAADLAEGDDGLAKALRAIVDRVSVMPARQAPEIRIEGHRETLLKRSFGECPLPYGYDPYGNSLQVAAPLSDFNYAGMFYNADSGLYLTQFRAYDPVAGRWLSRDPLSEVITEAFSLSPRVGVHFDGDAAKGPYDSTATKQAAHSALWQQDAVIGTYKFGADYHVADLADSLSVGPRRYVEGANLYAYVLDNPVQFVDPLGLATFCQKVRAICLAVMCYVTGQTPPPIEITPPPGQTISRPKDPRK